MMRSLYSGVAGLKTHQIKMDVIGNNIANVNTVAYKSQSITFAELMYQTTQAASGPNAETGRAGINAKQIGLGVQSAAISTAISQQGSSQNTGNAFDLRISGDAFFVVNGGAGDKFTRDGSFYVDAVGNLAMSSNGYNVMGWQVDANGDIVQDNVSALRILSAENMTSPPQVTSRANMSGIIDKMDPQILGDGKIVNLQIYDNLGYSYTARYTIQSTHDEGIYALTLEDLRDANNDSVLDKFDANIFTGTAYDATAPGTDIARAKTYSLSDKWKVDTSSGAKPMQIISSDGLTTIDPATASATKDPVTGLSEQDRYAQAWGVKDWNTLQNMKFSIEDTSTTPPTVTTVGFTELLNGTATSDGAKVRAQVLDTANGTLSSSGYTAAKGKTLTVAYDQISGALKSIGGNNGESFYMLIEPRDTTADNPFSMNSAQGDDKGAPGIQIFMNATSNVNNEKKSTISAVSGDTKGFGTGWAVGTMTGVSIQTDGKIFGAYDNGQTKLLGQIAFAKFANASGLEKEGDNLYAATMNSGEWDGIGVDVSADGGKVSTGILEMSNVDLSSEFTELITTQRGFQANSRIITVSDTLLEELVNLKR